MSEEKFQGYLNTPLPLILINDSRIRNLSQALFFLVLAIIPSRDKLDPFSLLATFIFTASFMGSLWLLVFPKSDSLTITSQGFTIRRICFWKAGSYQWKDISSPFTAKTIITTFYETSGKRYVFPVHNYGLTADQLAQLMNHWREKAVRSETKRVSDVAASIIENKPSNAPSHKAPETW